MEAKPPAETHIDMPQTKTDIEEQLERIRTAFNAINFKFNDESRESSIILPESKPKFTYERVHRRIRAKSSRKPFDMRSEHISSNPSASGLEPFQIPDDFANTFPSATPQLRDAKNLHSEHSADAEPVNSPGVHPPVPPVSLPPSEFDREARAESMGVANENSRFMSRFCEAFIGIEHSGLFVATIGGVVMINGRPTFLTVAHPFLLEPVPTSNFKLPFSLIFSDSDDESSSDDASDDLPESETKSTTTRALTASASAFLSPDKHAIIGTFRSPQSEEDSNASQALSSGVTYDWALMDPSQNIDVAPNRIMYKSKELVVSRLAQHDPEADDVLVLSGLDWKPRAAYCSGALSMVSVPGSETMVCGLRLGRPQDAQSLRGISGSWVINQNNGDLYGIVIAEDTSDGNLIMLRARDVFNDIEKVRGCLVSFPQEEERTAHIVENLAGEASMAKKKVTQPFIRESSLSSDEARTKKAPYPSNPEFVLPDSDPEDLYPYPTVKSSQSGQDSSRPRDSGIYWTEGPSRPRNYESQGPLSYSSTVAKQQTLNLTHQLHDIQFKTIEERGDMINAMKGVMLAEEELYEQKRRSLLENQECEFADSEESHGVAEGLLERAQEEQSKAQVPGVEQRQELEREKDLKAKMGREMDFHKELERLLQSKKGAREEMRAVDAALPRVRSKDSLNTEKSLSL